MRKITTVSTSLFSVCAFVIQIRLLYGYGNGNEYRSFFHYGNKKVPPLVSSINPFALTPEAYICFSTAIQGFSLESTNGGKCTVSAIVDYYCR